MPRPAEPADTAAIADQEAEFVRRIVEGDRVALTAWFLRFKDCVYQFVFYRLAGDAELAADATQQTFLLALERLGDFDPRRGTMTNWLRYLARNPVRSLLASHKRGKQLQSLWDGIDEQLRDSLVGLDSQLLPEAALDREETRQLVAMTLANLPEQYRQVLTDKYMQGKSLEQIATDRATTPAGVKSMIRRARHSFRDCFLKIAQLEMHDV